MAARSSRHIQPQIAPSLIQRAAFAVRRVLQAVQRAANW